MSSGPTFQWYEVTPPRGLTLSDVTGLVRTLVSRPKQGLLQLTPLVVFELHIRHGSLRWLLGHDVQLGGIPGNLSAQLPGLTLNRLTAIGLRHVRPAMTNARDIRFAPVAEPLRLDTAASVAAGLYQLADRLRPTEVLCCQWVVGPAEKPGKTPPSVFEPLESLGLLEPPKLDGSDRQAWKTKLAEPLYGVRGRIGTTCRDDKRSSGLLHQALAAIRLMETPRVRVIASGASQTTAQQLNQVMGRVRTWSSMLNAAELAALLVWPTSDHLSVPGSKLQLAAPPARLLVIGDSKHERILGDAMHPAVKGKLVTLPVQSCLSHVHLISPTGTGKSTTLARWVLSDALAGRSVLVVEPRGDLIADILSRLPEHLHDRAVVIDPGVKGNVVGINPLAGSTDDAERRADEILHVLKELFGTSIGPRSSDVLYHALLTASRLPDGTIVDAVALLINSAFRRRVLAQVGDPLVLTPFWAGCEAKSEAEQSQIVSPVLNKLRALTSRANIRRMLGQANPRFSLDDVFHGEQRLVFVNLNQGVLGGETARLLGCLLLTEVWASIQRRASIPRKQRHPVMCVVDEWASFVAGLDFADVLSQSRGLGASWTVAHQDLSQLSTTLTAAVFANARTRMVMRPSHGDALKLAGVLGEDVTATDLERLDAFHAVCRVLVDGTPSQAFEVTTPPLSPATTDAAAVVRASIERYGVDPLELDRLTTDRWQGTTTPDGPIGVRRRATP